MRLIVPNTTYQPIQILPMFLAFFIQEHINKTKEDHYKSLGLSWMDTLD
jgi:hypothetical protein